MQSSSAHSDRSETNYLEHTRCHVSFVVVVVIVVVFRFNASNVLVQLTKNSHTSTCIRHVFSYAKSRNSHKFLIAKDK